MNTDLTNTTVPSVRKAITVRATRERAFTVYAERFGTWWPKEHHIGAVDLADAVIEPKVGGRVYERGVDGSECDWGQVMVYDPPERLVHTWQLQGDFKYDPDPGKASEVEIRFVAVDADTTRIELEHRLFERHGAGAEAVRNGVSNPGGWEYTLRSFAEACGEIVA